MKNLREQFLVDNPDLTPKQKMVWEFYCAIQEMCHNNPNWVTETIELLNRVKNRNQFESLSHQACEESGNTQILEPE